MGGGGVVSASSAVASPRDVPEQAAAPEPQPAVQAPTRTRGPGRVRGERPAAYNYVGAEMRRIAALTTVVLAAVVGLSFVL